MGGLKQKKKKKKLKMEPFATDMWHQRPASRLTSNTEAFELKGTTRLKLVPFSR